MWQVVRETQDGLMEANFYTDEWPDFTTVISQESAPRLSEVLCYSYSGADLKISKGGGGSFYCCGYLTTPTFYCFLGKRGGGGSSEL